MGQVVPITTVPKRQVDRSVQPEREKIAAELTEDLHLITGLTPTGSYRITGSCTITMPTQQKAVNKVRRIIHNSLEALGVDLAGYTVKVRPGPSVEAEDGVSLSAWEADIHLRRRDGSVVTPHNEA